MAKSPNRRPRRGRPSLGRRLLRSALIAGLVALGLLVAAIGSLRVLTPPINYYQAMERARLGALDREWLSLAEMSPHLPLAAAAAEDANFCVHHGFDLDAIRAAWRRGARRGASTISQQTAKNVFLWPERSWLRKGLEAGLTVLIEALWGKRRIIEIYLNVAEFDEGVFGVGAASRHYFGVTAARIDPRQAARLMAVLPSPKTRSAARPTPSLERRARQIRAGADTLAADGRAACFERAVPASDAVR